MTEDQPDRTFSPPIASSASQWTGADPEQPPVWPKVIGIIAVILGGLGILGGGWALIMPFFMDLMMGLMPKGQVPGIESLQMLKDWQGWLAVSSLLMIGLATLLLFVGIGLLKRRRWAVRLGVWWSILKVLFVVAQNVVGLSMQEAQMEALSEQMSNIPGMSSGFISAMAVMGMIVGIAWGWALPVFLLIWFSRAKIKEEVAGWN